MLKKILILVVSLSAVNNSFAALKRERSVKAEKSVEDLFVKQQRLFDEYDKDRAGKLERMYWSVGHAPGQIALHEEGYFAAKQRLLDSYSADAKRAQALRFKTLGISAKEETVFHPFGIDPSSILKFK